MDFLKSHLEIVSQECSTGQIFAGYTGSKNQVWKRQKIKLKNQFCEKEILRNQVQIDRGNNQ